MTELLEAVVAGDVAAVTRFLAQGANASAHARGRPLLHWAAQEGHVDVSRLLLQHGADINATDEWGFFPRWVAAGEGHLEVVQLLLDGGADLHQTGGGDWTALEVACAYGHGNVASHLIAVGADPDRPDDEGHTAVWHAVANEWEETLEAIARTSRGREVIRRQRADLAVAAQETGNPGLLRLVRALSTE